MKPVNGKRLKRTCTIYKNELNSILNAIHEDILITNGKGVVIHVSPTFEEVYGINHDKAVGMSVFEMEAEGYFKPSITAIVLKTGKKVTMSQKNNKGRDIVVTATPVFDQTGQLSRVISFSRDVTDFLSLKEQYSILENKMIRYEEELEELRREATAVDDIIAKDPKTQKVLDTVKRIAPFDTNVLLTGESGVGKGVFAKILHNSSKRFRGPFLEINCGAIPENLLEPELFGYEKGSFSGASKKGKLGLIELSKSGTLFLDEIGELPLNLQVKMLQVIQAKTIKRVGGIQEIPVDFRLVAATNKDLKLLLKKKLFREDLYYRLNVISIEIPPLRERDKDIIPMIAFFVRKINQRHGIQKVLAKESYDILSGYRWPGNVRELENLLEHIMLTAIGAVIEAEHLPEYVRSINGKEIDDDRNWNLQEALNMVEEKYVKRAWEQTKTTIGVAALLGISQPTAVRKIRKYIR